MAESNLREDRDILAEALPDSVCDGSSLCHATVHIHGCYSDDGYCDHPEEYHGPRFGAEL